MNWKNLPEWKKGVKISLVILVVIQIIGIIMSQMSKGSGDLIGAILSDAFLFLPAILILLPINLIPGIMLSKTLGAIVLVIGYLLYPILGGLIGLLVSKFRN